MASCRVVSVNNEDGVGSYCLLDAEEKEEARRGGVTSKTRGENAL